MLSNKLSLMLAPEKCLGVPKLCETVDGPVRRESLYGLRVQFLDECLTIAYLNR